MERTGSDGVRLGSGLAERLHADRGMDGGSASGQLPRFLSVRLEDYGRQMEFAKSLRVSPGTVTKWLSGENMPNFESCLLIASYFGVDPGTIFKMSGRLEHYRLFVKHFRTNVFYGQLHSRLQELIDDGRAEEVDQMLAQVEKELEETECL